MKVNEGQSLNLLALYGYVATKDTYWEVGKASPSSWCVWKGGELEEHDRKKAGRASSVPTVSGATPLGILKGLSSVHMQIVVIHNALVPAHFSLGSWCHRVTSQGEKNDCDADFAEW